MADSSQEAENIKAVIAWASEKKVSLDTIRAVIDMGFTSLEALECITREEVKKSNAPVGQQKLLLKAVVGLGVPEVDPKPVPANDTPLTGPPDNAQGEAVGDQEAFARKLMEQLQALQSTAPAVPPVVGQPNGLGQAIGGNPTGPQGQVDMAPVTGMLSWQDPQVYLKSVVNKVQCLNIVDFVDLNQSQTERVLSTVDDLEFVCRSGSRKPKLENCTISQWSLANIAILYKLFQDGSIQLHEVFDYLSYTSHIYSLIGTHELASVYFYDREYRRLQAAHKFRWGTAVGHLSAGFLRLRTVSNTPQGSATKFKTFSKPERPSYRAPFQFQNHTNDGKMICKNFNTRMGCTFTGCKFEHVCNVPGCGRGHPGAAHAQSKN